jgi:RNA polymerase sigma factor (sigma-70 family)
VNPDLARDKALVAEAKRDPEAFGAIFDTYYGPILTYVLRRTGDADLSQDIAAQTFLKALENLWRYRFTGVPLSAWLYRIAGNELKMHYRKKRLGYSLEALVERGFDAEDRDEREALEQLVREDREFAEVSAALRELPVKYQEAVSLRYMEGKKYAEIAMIMGKREGTVRSLVSRGLATLKERLQRPEDARIIGNEGRSDLSIITQRNP